MGRGISSKLIIGPIDSANQSGSTCSFLEERLTSVSVVRLILLIMIRVTDLILLLSVGKSISLMFYHRN
jgi:hypothetical protein